MSRPVWLTREQRDFIEDWTDEPGVREVVTAWDAAPHDAGEAIYDAIYRHLAGRTTFGQLHDATADVLRALGKPNP